MVRMILLLMAAGWLAAGCGGNRGGDTLSATGTIEAVEVTIASKAGGEIRKVLVEEGTTVKQGDTLAVIDHTLLDLQCNQAAAGVEMAAANLALLLQGARSEDRQQAEELVNQAEVSLKVAEADAARMQELYEAGSIPTKQRDDAQARAAVLRAQHNAARQAAQKAGNLARPEEIRAARAKVAQAQAGLDILRQQIGDCVVISPTGGTVTNRLVEPGELIGQGMPLLTIIKYDKVDLMIYVPEKDLGKVRLGQEAAITVDSYPDKSITGTVIYISPEAEFTPKNIQTKEDRVKLVFGVKIQVENPEGILKPGMPADAGIQLNTQ